MEHILSKAPAHRRDTAENEIRELLERFVNALRAADLDTIMAQYAEDVVAYDAIARVQFKGIDAYRAHWKYCLSLCSGPAVFEMHDLAITAAEDVAFCRFLSRCGNVAEGGEEKASWMRATVCLRKQQGRWRVVHEHYSAPFDIDSGKALLDIAP